MSLVMKFTHETPEYADIWWPLMLLSCCSALCQTVWSLPACLLWVFFTPLFASHLCHASRDSHSSMKRCVPKKRPSSVNTWLSLHLHPHLIMGEALISGQYVRGGTTRERSSNEQCFLCATFSATASQDFKQCIVLEKKESEVHTLCWWRLV